jgi:FkbM family methyltransferase
MRNVILKLTGSTLIRKTVKALRLHRLANQWLRWVPVENTLPESGIRYRARRVESLALSAEMFDQGLLYTSSCLPESVSSFADLGCNVGYFTCWLCDRMKSTELKGLMVDANGEAVDDARWHVQVNRLNNVRVLEGIVGADQNSEHASFFIHVSNVCSTTLPPDGSSRDSSTWTKIQAPCVRVEEAWLQSFGDTTCDLLKIDVEGSEMDFFRNEGVFLNRVQTILVEWHKWRVSRNELEAQLSGNGFCLESILHEDAELGTAVFCRKAAI